MNRHLLTVWNPAYASDALDDHVAVLLDWARAAGAGKAGRDDVYVWWAKVRSTRRDGPLPHAEDVLVLQTQIENGIETHLYLTDYRSLYVGWLDEITADDVLRETPDEAAHMPDYYAEHRADFWFRLHDVRRIVADDTPEVIRVLQRLNNVMYHDRPVSLYGGMVDLPLIVTAPEEPSWFGGASALLEDELWAERDAQMRGETGRIAHELRDNLLGSTVWRTLDPTTRTFLATGEAVFRARRADPGFDFSAVAVEYAKAVETELNATLFAPMRPLVRGRPTSERIIAVGDNRYDLAGDVPHLGLGVLRRLLMEESVFRACLRTTFPHDWKWLEGELPAHLAPLAELRNPAAHSSRFGADQIADQRERVLGIGCEGLIVRIARIRRRAADPSAVR